MFTIIILITYITIKTTVILYIQGITYNYVELSITEILLMSFSATVSCMHSTCTYVNNTLVSLTPTLTTIETENVTVTNVDLNGHLNCEFFHFLL